MASSQDYLGLPLPATWSDSNLFVHVVLLRDMVHPPEPVVSQVSMWGIFKTSCEIKINNVLCYPFQTKCTPFCKSYYYIDWFVSFWETNVTTGLRRYNVCLKRMFYGMTEDCSLVYEAYQLRNPRKIIQHTVDYKVFLNPHPSPPKQSRHDSRVIGGILAGAFVVLLPLVLLYCYCRRKIRPTAHIVLQCDTVSGFYIYSLTIIFGTVSILSS